MLNPKLLLLQIEDRSDPMLNAFIDINRKMCKKHGVEYVFLKQGRPDIPHYWWKIFELNRIMQERKDIELVMWLDSDAFLTQWKRINPIQLANAHPNVTMFISPDAPPKYTAKFCAGSFVLRNNENGRHLMSEWQSYYDPSKWEKYDNGRWKTKGYFGGSDYEQGAFIDKLLPYANQKNILSLPYYVFNENKCTNPHPDSISIHLAGEYKENHLPECTKLFSSSTSPLESFTDPVNLTTLSVMLVLAVILFIFKLRRAKK